MKPKTRHLRRTAPALWLLAIALATALPVWANHREPPPNKPAEVLNRRELLILESIAWQVQSMMTLFEPVETSVWPHGVRDQRGRQGLFIGSQAPLFTSQDEATAATRKKWVVCALIAAVKYAEGSQLGHIAFTDARRVDEHRSYYDLDMTTAREILRLFHLGILSPDETYRLISSWQKVTRGHAYASE
jgi:hypothetical protein